MIVQEKVLPNIGSVYRHYKGERYKIIAVAQHHKTGEQWVVYQALYGNFILYIRPLIMFRGIIVIEGKEILRFTEVCYEDISY